jgi:iron complex transport system substrate-binding protein
MRLIATIAIVIALALTVLVAPAVAGFAHLKVTDPYAPVDYFGVEFEPAEYSRIVTLAPNLTEIVYFLGAFERVVGVTNYDTYPPEVEDCERIGGFIDPDIERIVALRPDLVLAYRGNPLPVIHKLKELEVPVFVLDNPGSLDELYLQMLKLGWLLAADEERVTTVREFKSELDDAFELGARLPRHPRVMMLACSLQPPFYAAGQGTFIDDLIRLAGGDNAFGGAGFSVVTPEEFIVADPEFLLIPELPDEGFREKMLKALRAQPFLARTTALETGQVLFIDQDIISRPGPRITEALAILQEALIAATI